MSTNETLSDELLNAFIDGELDPTERGMILAQLENDNELAGRLNESRYLKELVLAAKPADNKITNKHVKFPANKRSHYLSAAAILILSLLTGLYFLVMPVTQEPIVLADSKLNAIIESHANKPEIKVVIHITSNDQQAVNVLLDQAEHLARLNHKLGKAVRVELVANGKGLTVFRQDRSLHKARINTLRNKYDNLLFIACEQTMQRILKTHNKHVSLIPGVASIKSGNDEVTLRRKQGWSYLTI